MNNAFSDADFIDDFDMMDDDTSSDSSYKMLDNSMDTDYNQNLTSYQQPINNDNTSPLASMYDDKSSVSFEDELRTAKPFVQPVEEKVVEEAPKEVTYSDDFMDYDPMLHNDLVTDGNYTITEYDSSKESDYVPEQTNFDSEEMMEFYSNENVAQEKPKEEEKEVVETFNTNGMSVMQQPQIDNQNNNSGETTSSDVNMQPMEKVPRFINNDIDVDNVLPTDGDIPESKGSISIYNKKEEYEKSQTRKAAELVFTVIVISLLILVVSFFPDVNNFFTNLGK